MMLISGMIPDKLIIMNAENPRLGQRHESGRQGSKDTAHTRKGRDLVISD